MRILSVHAPEYLEGYKKAEQAILRGDDSHLFEVDLVVMGVGIRLDTGIARGAGLEMGEKGAVLVDECLCTSDPHIYAAGDIVAMSK